jgi:hypothetical protein
MLRRALYTLLLLAGSAAHAAAQSNTDIITGRVIGPNGEPVAGATIRATSLETEIQRATLSNAQGRYTLVFPQGGGEYELEVTQIGLAPVSRALRRVGDEEVLVAEIRMDIQPITLQGVDVTAQRQPRPSQGDPGGQERAVTGEMLERLPIDPTDLAAIAALTPGVIALADSLGAAGFSVLGQGPAGNQVTLDGLSFDAGDAFGGGGMGTGVPQEAVRMTRVITNTYDVSRGQFSGGQIATTSRGGTNQLQGSFNYALRDPTLQWTVEDGPFAGSFRQNRASGGVGGPIIRNRLFYFGSFQMQRRSEGLQSLLTADARSLQRLGASPDSVGRFLSALADLGMHAPGLPSPSSRISDNLTLLGRVDFNVTDMHTLMVRADGRWSEQDNFRTGALGLPQSGGVVEGAGGGIMASLTSRFGNGWINELRAYGSENRRSMVPNALLPEGRVRVSSDLADGTRGITTLTFGGGAFGTDSNDRSIEVSNELSVLLGLSHRLRIGGMLNSTSSTQEIGSNRYGTFTFNSLAAFGEGRPASFTRALVPGTRESGGINAALYGGDTWRVSDRLQLTYGLRLEGSAVSQQPQHNPLIEDRFGRRTDRIPSEVRVSPRAGFSYTVGSGGAAPSGFGGMRVGGMGGMGGMAGMAGMAGLGNPAATVIRGGFGEFRARPPWSLFAAARDATGLPDGQSQLYCVGDAVPFPDWAAFAADPAAIPAACAGLATPLPASGRGTSVTVFAPDFGAARSWRASLGFQRRLFQLVGISADATYALGRGQQGMRDLNLETTPQFALAAEGGRPVFVPVHAVVPSTGEIGFLASRIHPELGPVNEVHSELRSRNLQLTVGLTGSIPRARTFLQTSYTFSRSEDQGSAGGWGLGRGGIVGGFGGFGGMGGGGSASLPVTAGNPNLPEWGTSDFERRHSLVATLGRNFRPWLDLTLIGRATSGSPYTPLVGGDINGDGARNDPAFIFDPARTASAALAADMSRLLRSLPGQAQACLTRQLGTVAGRNSCSGPWNFGLDLRANLQPMLPGIDRRLSISVDATNTLTGVDQLLHGSGGLRGWGQTNRVDPILLYPRGFDAATQSYRYEVNERFGAPRQGGLAIRNPFQIQISGRLAVGAQRGRITGMRGIFISAGGGAAGGAGGGGLLGAAILNPIDAIVRMADSLELTAEQVGQLEEVSRSLQERQAELQEALRTQMMQAFQRDPASAMQALQPRLQEAREQMLAALDEAEAILTPEQWERIPPEVKEPPQVPAGFGGQGRGGGAGGRLPGGAGGQGQSGPSPAPGGRGGAGGPPHE